MATKTTSQPVTRRNVVRGAAGLGLLAPLALGASHAARAQGDALDYSGHPAVGIWIEGGSGPTYGYNVIHADGTTAWYNPWGGNTGGNDPNLAALGFGVWQPISDRAIEASFRVAWIDATVTSLLTIRGQLTVNEAGTLISGPYKMRMIDASGEVTLDDGGFVSAERMQLEPFDDPEPSEATPEE